ncbi:MAG: hypothetical protein IKM38_01040 [Christensenellaceae bacterium]|nr:hypothetical protein [Christensenellaceae bacterium]
MEKRIGCFKGCLWLMIDSVVFCFLLYFVLAICFGDKSVAVPFGFHLNPVVLNDHDLATLNEIIGQDTEGITFSLSEEERSEELLKLINQDKKENYTEKDIDAFYYEENNKWYFKTKDEEAYLVVDAETGELLLYVKGDRLA